MDLLNCNLTDDIKYVAQNLNNNTIINNGDLCDGRYYAHLQMIMTAI